MREIPHSSIRIDAGFWAGRLALNATSAIDHQWRMLEETGCIENFRISAGHSDRFREGYFFADSDAYKWLEAACRIYAQAPDERLRDRIHQFAGLIRAVQTSDGYIFTYNQIHFPGQRWVNLPVEHELYCMGHLIEACVSHHETFGADSLLEVARRAADLLVREFMEAGPSAVCGHEEIELALVRLHRATGDSRYLELAQRFVARRGRDRLVAWHNWQADRSQVRRNGSVRTARAAYAAARGGKVVVELPPGNATPKPRFAHLRFLASALSGKYMQMDRAVSERREPVGHAVRFSYLQTAAAMLERAGAGGGWRPALEESWDAMVQRRMFVTGGLGSQPVIEGFGRDYELDPEYAYNETCAALASMLWAHEMGLLTGQPKYADLLEWQLYNASLVGLGQNGDAYFYNNPLRCAGQITRQPWFLVPCCPSNISRVWARLGEYLYAVDGDALVVNQYVTNTMAEDAPVPLSIRMASELPWEGAVAIDVLDVNSQPARLRLRVPSWADGITLVRNGSQLSPVEVAPAALVSTACGYSPYGSRMVEIPGPLRSGDRLRVAFDMPVRVLRSDPRVGSRGRGITLARGPLVYCLESVDNPEVDILTARVDTASFEPNREPSLLGGVTVLRGRTRGGARLTAIPYYCWGNRGESQVNVVPQE